MRGRHLRRERPARRLRRVVGTVLQVALVGMALAIIGLPLATDHAWRTVETGSMRPTIEPGDVILASPTSGTPEVGELVVFEDPVHGDRDVVHRFVGHDVDGRLLTQGDANDAPDPWTLAPGDVSGTVALQVPKVGFLVQAMDTKAGILVFLVVPSLLIVASELRVWYRFVRYGREAFEPAVAGRHLVGGTA